LSSLNLSSIIGAGLGAYVGTMLQPKVLETRVVIMTTERFEYYQNLEKKLKNVEALLQQYRKRKKREARKK
jgi:AmiR/NasT family two-component response regulator